MVNKINFNINLMLEFYEIFVVVIVMYFFVCRIVVCME